MLILNTLQSWALMALMFTAVVLFVRMLARLDARIYGETALAMPLTSNTASAENATVHLSLVADTLCSPGKHSACTALDTCPCHCHTPFDQELDELNSLLAEGNFAGAVKSLNVYQKVA